MSKIKIPKWFVKQSKQIKEESEKLEKRIEESKIYIEKLRNEVTKNSK